MGVKIENIEVNTSLGSKSSTSLFQFLNQDISFKKKLSDKVKHQFYHDISLLLEAGVDLNKSLELFIEGISKAQKIKIFGSIHKSLISGSSFSDAIHESKQFSDYDYFSLKIGEESGSLHLILSDLAEFYKGRIEFKQRLINTFTYPFVVLFTAAVAVYFMLTFIVPIFQDAFKRFGGELPYITQKVIQLSKITSDYGMLILLGILFLFALTWFYRKNKIFKDYYYALLLRIPIFGDIIKKIYLSRFCHSMNLLIGVNYPLTESLNLVNKMLDFYPLDFAIKGAITKIIQGSSLHKALTEYEIFPKRMLSLIEVAEEVNKLDVLFEQIRNQYDTEIENKSKTISGLLEPVLIIFIGTFVGFILVAMYLPLFQLGAGIQ